MIKQVRKIRYFHLLTVGTILALVVSSQIIVHNLIRNQENDGLLINVAARQSMLSQKIAKGAIAIQNNLDKPKELGLRKKELEWSLQLWNKAHDAMLNETDQLGFPISNSDYAQDMLSNLNPYHEQISEAAMSLLDDNLNAKEVEAGVNRLLEQESVYLPVIDEIANSYANTSKNRNRALQNVELVLSGILILALLAELFLIFNPLYKSLKVELNRRLDMEKEMVLAKNKAETANKAKSTFLANMSHEIRTPLHAILGFVKILKNNNLSDENKSHVDLLDASSKSLLSIVDDILIIDKIESGTIQLEERHFNPSQKIKEIIDTYSHLFSEKGLYIKSDFKSPFGSSVIGDQNKLSQIIVNVIKNASKFTVEGGVSITYKEEQVDDNLKVNITVRDTGIGIPKNKINSIFNRFTQIDSSLKKQHEGSGLGLAISKDLATKLGGTILVKSSVNKGSQFDISVVFKIDTNQKNNDIKETYANLNLSHLKALIVDDNKINIVILKKILEDAKINVDIALNGKEALEKVKTIHYNMVFMDIHMPEMDGFEATQLIRKFNTDLKIFGLSANVTSEAIAKAFDCGMNNYITKPFNKEQLYNLILITLEYNELNPKTDSTKLISKHQKPIAKI